MVKNIVFDFGQVLVSFNPDYMCSKYIDDPEDIRLVSDVLFDRCYWEKLDAGTISDEEVILGACSRLPERLHGKVAQIYDNWVYNIPEIEGMRDCIALARRKGYGVYLLSNISLKFVSIYKSISILDGFDGYVFSSVAGCVKPSYEIFDHLCKKFDLRASETLFIDDNEKNIAGASAYGIIPYHFDGNAQALYSYIEKL